MDSGGVAPSGTGLQRATPVSGGDLVVRSQPAADAPVVTRLGPRTPLGSGRVLLAIGRSGGWVEVALPIRPNGSTGWVAVGQVRLQAVPGQIVVDLAARRMTITLDGQVVADTPVGVGTPDDPTPTGRFYVTDRVRPPDPGGPYGAFALGLSAHSTTLSEFDGRDGQVGIHGTNAPTSIGRASSHGCVRVPAEVVRVLDDVPLGTPVLIN